MRFPYSAAGLKEIINNVIKMNLLKDAYVRLALWKAQSGTIILVVAKKYTPYSSEKYRIGFSATVSHLRLDENSFLPRIKSTNRLLYQLSLQEARKKGFDEAIILNSRGYIAEGSRSNLFFIKGKTMFTPAQESGCLAGITRELIFDLNKGERLQICEGNFTIQDLREAGEAFFTNSLIGVIGLTRLEKKKIGNGKSGRQTEYFRKKFYSLLKNDK
jgi:branched-chain amino acid aminotransferase